MPFVKEIMWEKVPALRLLLPFICGILLQFYLQFSFTCVIISFFLSFILILIASNTTLRSRFRLRYVKGCLITVMVLSTGAVALWQKDVRNKIHWFGNSQKDSLIVKITEPPVERSNSFKAVADVVCGIEGGKTLPLSGKLMLSFPKDQNFVYGSRIVIWKGVREIQNADNPGGFDYKRWSLMQGITHQVYLSADNSRLLQGKDENYFFRWLYRSRAAIAGVFKKYIKDKKDQGLAEALLIGVKDDLDKELVKTYANTGVVHIIAISGLHLALIYGILMLLTRPAAGRKLIWLRFFIVVAGLWAFSLIAGGQPSILRAAVMFTAVALKMVVDRRGSVYNTLALAAFALLCYDPFWLWDAGFQLSFLAVLGIIIFYRPVYNLFYSENKIVDTCWKLSAASVAAQVLTLPLTLYYFHQFPVAFLPANIVAVPLSSLLVYAEIGLCSLSFLPSVATYCAKLIEWMIWLMNSYIEMINKLPFGLWEGISISPGQCLLLFVTITGIALWLMKHKTGGLYLSLCSLTFFFALRSFSFASASERQALVVYNIPKHSAIELISGRKSFVTGDEWIALNHRSEPTMQTARTAFRIRDANLSRSRVFHFNGKLIMIIDDVSGFNNAESGRADFIILAGNAVADRQKLAGINRSGFLIIDSSVPFYKASTIKKICDSLRISCYNVVDNGAFVKEFQSLPLPPPT